MIWTVTRSEQQQKTSARWAAKAQAYEVLRGYEQVRQSEYTKLSGHYERLREQLVRQSSLGKDEQTECVAFFQGRAAADLAYAQSIAKQRLQAEVVTRRHKARRRPEASRAAGHAVASSVAPRRLDVER